MRATTLGLLLLVSVRAVFNMGGAAGRAGSGGGRERAPPPGERDPHSVSQLPVPTADPKFHTGELQSTQHATAAFHNTAPDSSSTASLELPPSSAPTTHPFLPNTSPFSHPHLSDQSPGLTPELSDRSPAATPELSNWSTRATAGLFLESPDAIPTVDPKIFNKRRYRSPRVLFSAHPPDAAGPGARVRRRAGQTRHRGVYSVCDSVSNWVGNKSTAIDITGNEVTVLPDVRINNIVKKQYFFETTCHGPPRPSRSGGSSCLGIDSRHWNSYCTNTHTFVLAMTSFKSLVAWRLVRINAACVCVLSRKSWRN